MDFASWVGVVILVAAAALVASAVLNHQLAKKAERRNPHIGHFLEVDGVRLHYIDHGKGDALVLLHGNGSMIQDFISSGLVEMAAEKFRVIVFDRPGFGYSERPRGAIWTATAQAERLHRALGQIGVSRAIVLGHSWGGFGAVALALEYPDTVSTLVLASGYYYPSLRFDVVALSLPALPVLGDVIRYTLSPFASRLFWPLILRKIFGPAPVPDKFAQFPMEMAVSPSQLRASAAESFLMVPNALAYAYHYGHFKMPVVIIAGSEDRVVDTEKQSRRLHRHVKHSAFYCVRNAGHMVHQTATSAVMSAIEQATDSRAVDGHTREISAE